MSMLLLQIQTVEMMVLQVLRTAVVTNVLALAMVLRSFQIAVTTKKDSSLPSYLVSASQ